MSGIANSLSSAVSPTTVPCKHRTTSRSRPAARRLSRRSNDGASTRRFSGCELRIAESAGVSAAWPARRPGPASAPTISHPVTQTARRIPYNSETVALALCHTVNNSSKPQAERRKGRNLRLPWGLHLSACARLQRGPAYGLRLSAGGCRVTWLVGDRRGSVLPTPQSLLRSVYAGRLCVAGAIYLAAALKFAVAAPLDVLVTSFVLFAAVAAVTAYFASRVSVMGAEREALAGELRQARLEAADVLRSVPTGIVTVDQAGHLLYCNPAAEQIFGFKERQWRGRPIMPEFAKIAPEVWAAITATARRGGR